MHKLYVKHVASHIISKPPLLYDSILHMFTAVRSSG